jgi:predicted acyl esterase
MRNIGRRCLRGFALVGLALLLGTAAPPASAPSPALAEIGDGSVSTPWPGGRWRPAAPSYGMTVVENVPVPMDDGAVLMANVGYPTDLATGQRAPGKFPVLLSQSPYAMLGASQTQPDSYFVTRGYIYAMVQVRGTGASEGALGFFSARDAQDGAALVDWVARRLDGSNGVVGLHGCSYLGINQVFTAAMLSPGSPVKAMVPVCGPNQRYTQYFIGGIAGSAVASFNGCPNSTFGPRGCAFFNPVYDDVFSGGDAAYNRDFWQQRSVLTNDVAGRVVRNGIPALFLTGWNEYSSGPFELYAQFQSAYRRQAAGERLARPGAASAPGALEDPQSVTGRYQLIAGPWNHGVGLDKALHLEWYDTWLKGENTGIENTRTPLHLYEAGSNRWINASTYPIVAQYTPYYLGSGGALAAEPGPADGGDAIAWAQPTALGSTLTYTTRPLANGATLAGPASVSVYASSSNSNLELIAELYDVAPDGTAARISRGAILGSLHAVDESRSWRDQNGLLTFPYQPFAADAYVPPGQTERYDIAMNPRLWSVPPGHSLRVRLSTQSAPSDCASPQPYPCVLTPPQQATLPGGVYQVQHGPLSPSAINLPLLPFAYFPTAYSAITPTSLGQEQPLYWGPPAQ